MNQLCKNLSFSIIKEPDPGEPGAERIRMTLSDDAGMMEVETIYHINKTSEQSARYHIRESVTIGLRQLVSEAFRLQLISDSPGQWSISTRSSKV